jgi:hypothetical protein
MKNKHLENNDIVLRKNKIMKHYIIFLVVFLIFLVGCDKETDLRDFAASCTVIAYMAAGKDCLKGFDSLCNSVRPLCALCNKKFHRGHGEPQRKGKL